MAGKKSGFVDVEEVRDAGCEDLVLVISARTYDGRLACCVFKEFEDDDGNVRRTTFLQGKHLEAARRLYEVAERRMAELEAADKSRWTRMAEGRRA